MNFTRYSLARNFAADNFLDPIFKFERASTATRINKTTGLIETVAANVPRLEKDGLLIEGASGDRAQESCVVDIAHNANTWFSRERGTFVFEALLKSLSNENGSRVFEFAKGDWQNSIFLQCGSKVGEYGIDVISGGVVGYEVWFQRDTHIKVALTWSGQRVTAIAVNGSLLASGMAAQVPPLERLALGSSIGGFLSPGCHIQYLQIFPRFTSAGVLQAMSALQP